VKVPDAVTGLLERPVVVFVRNVFDAYGSAAGGLLAAGLAYSALFTAVPTSLLVLGVAGFVAREPGFQEELVGQLALAFPPLAELLDEALVAVSQGAGLSSIFGAIGLIWAISQFYSTLDVAFSRIFRTLPERDMARRTLRGFLWVVILVGLVVSVIVVTSMAAVVDATLPTQVPVAGTVVSVLTSPISMLVIAVVVIGLVYRVLPPRPPSWGAIVPVAVIVGVIITLLTQAFAILVPFLVGAAAIVGSLAAAFIALAWLSFSFQALLLGAAAVYVRSSPPTSGAPESPPEERGQPAC
jgi:YihY family inner membrane protein